MHSNNILLSLDIGLYDYVSDNIVHASRDRTGLHPMRTETLARHT